MAVIVFVAFFSHLLKRDVIVGKDYLWEFFSSKTVLNLELETSSGFYVLLKDKDHWFVKLSKGNDEFRFRADSAKIVELFEFMASEKPKYSKVYDDFNTVRFMSFGFDRSDNRIRLNRSRSDGPGRSVLIMLGKMENPERATGVYAWSPQTADRLYLLPIGWIHELDHPARFYFDQRLFGVNEKKIAGVFLSGPEGKRLELVRNDGVFSFLGADESKGATVDQTAVKLYLHKLATLKALSLEDVKLTGEDEFWLDIEVRDEDGNVENLKLYRSKERPDKIVGRSTWQPEPFSLTMEGAEQLSRTMFEFLDRHVVRLETGKVRFFRMVFGDQTFEGEKTETGWVEKGRDKEILGIDMSIWRLKELESVAEPSGSLPASAQWTMTCELFYDENEATTLTFYLDPTLPAGQCWLKPGGEEVYYPVSSQLLKDLQGQIPSKK